MLSSTVPETLADQNFSRGRCLPINPSTCSSFSFTRQMFYVILCALVLRQLSRNLPIGTPTALEFAAMRAQEEGPPDYQTDAHQEDHETASLPPPPRILLYITTHFSESHLRYFHCCWPQLTKESPLIQQSHVVVAATNATPVSQLELDFVEQLFRRKNPKASKGDHPSRLNDDNDDDEAFPEYTFWTPPNASHLSHCQQYKVPSRQNPQKISVEYKQCLANYGVAAGIPLWKGYDWVIRLNPDVLLRESQFLLEPMRHNASLDAVLIHCGKNTKQVHTDFFAVRPKALWPHLGLLPAADSNGNSTNHTTGGPSPPTTHERMLEAPFWKMAKAGYKRNHERTAFREFRPILVAQKHQWVPRVKPSEGICRARGPQSPVYHGHDSCTSAQDMVCRALQGWDLSQ